VSDRVSSSSNTSKRSKDRQPPERIAARRRSERDDLSGRGDDADDMQGRGDDRHEFSERPDDVRG
jgi:hypothetical protein